MNEKPIQGSPEPVGTDQTQTQVNLCSYIFSGSATMVGVCVTVIGIVRVAVSFSGLETFADDVLFAASVLFMLSCLLAYWGLHSHEIERLRRIERVADALFICGLLCLVLACSLITFEMLPSSPIHTTSH